MKIKKPFFSKDFDKLLAIVALILSALGFLVLIVFSSNISSIIIVGFLVASFIAYLYFRPKIQFQKGLLVHSIDITDAGIITINLCFILILFLSILLIVYRPEPYTRPIAFFVLSSILAGLLALEIISSENKLITTYSLLIKIIILGILLRWISLIIFPGPVWFDPWYHENIVSQILSSSHIPETGLQSYEKLPIYHLLISSIILFTGLNFKAAFLIFICPIEVILQVLLIFMIGNKLFLGNKISLFASLLLIVSDYNIENGIIEYPNGFAIIFILAIVYIILKSQITTSARWIMINIIIMLMVILTHTLAAMAIAIMILSFWFGSYLYNNIFQKNKKRDVASFSLLLLFSIAMFSWWMYASGHYILLVKVITWAFQADKYFPENPIKELKYLASIPINEVVYDKMGFTIYFFFSSIGCLFLMSKYSYSKINGFVYALGSIVLAIIGFLGTVFNLLFIPNRWIFMSQTMLSIPAAIGISIIIRIDKYKRALITSIIVIMTFFMITDSIANFDTPILSPKIMVRASLYLSEIQSIDTILAYDNNTIASDQLAIAYISNKKDIKTQLINDSLDKQEFISLLGSTIIIRKTIIDSPFYAYGTIWKLYFDPRDILINEDMNCVYDSGSTIAFIKSNNGINK